MKSTLPHNCRLLIVRPDRVGDVIISTSCLPMIRRQFPGWQLRLLTTAVMRPLLARHPALEGFHCQPEEIARWMPHAVVHLHPCADIYRAAFHAGAPVRIGYGGTPIARYLTHSLPDLRLSGQKHEAEYNLDLFAILGLKPGGPLVPSVNLPEPARASLRTKLPWPLENSSYAVLNLTAHSPIARWPATRFAELARWLVSAQQLRVVVTGADREDPSVRRFRGVWRDGYNDLCDLTGRTDLAELGWLLHHARVVVTRNTGTSHLAAAVGCPVVDLFGRPGAIYGPTRWRPLTGSAVIVTGFLPRGRFESRARHWKRCFESIKLDEVQRATLRALQFSEHREGKNRS